MAEGKNPNDDAALHFAKALASNKKYERDRTLKRLISWVRKRSVKENGKLQKCVFYLSLNLMPV